MATKENAVISIPALTLKTINLKIIGDSPLISHAWSEKSKLMMLQKQTKKATAGKEIRRPSAEFADSLYWLTEKPNFDGLTDEEVQKVLSEVIPKSKFSFRLCAVQFASSENLLKFTAFLQFVKILAELEWVRQICAIVRNLNLGLPN